ncbi:MAG: uncharacterized protein JWM34_1737 [Ilumatobacteraceae bacterium]|nr:uncharacterized protein [Ilumatobacteraceae bacterium]
MRRDERFSVEGHVAIEIDLASGNVTVQAGASGVVSISAEMNGSGDVDVSRMGDMINVRQSRKNRSGRVMIDAPVGTDVTVRGTSVQVSARGALGMLRTRMSSGGLEADDLVRLDTSLSSGHVRVGTVRDEALVSSSSGHIVIRSVGGRLEATSSSGDVRIDRASGDVEAGTASGSVAIDRCDGSTIAVRTVSGNIRVGLPSGIRVEPEISTMSGKVRLPDGSPAAVTGERRPVRLRLRSVSGDIRVERAG